MKHELSSEAEKKLDEQAEKLPDDDRGDPVEQTLDVPTTGSPDDAAEKVKDQYEEKSGLELDDETARDIAEKPRDADSDSTSDSDSEDDDSNKDDDSDRARDSDKGESSDSDGGDDKDSDKNESKSEPKSESTAKAKSEDSDNS